MNILKIFSFIFLYPILIQKSCKEGSNNCIRCNSLTNICTKCILDIYSPDEDGGCTPSGKCLIGKNYCEECNLEGTKCNKCEIGYYPDDNGGCSYDENCEISYKGNCLKCKLDFILVGENQGFKICKSIFSNDLFNCEIINNKTGLCQSCKEGFFLNNGDKKCSYSENCYESIYGRCTLCNKGYYLNVKENICKWQSGPLLFCRESLDGKKCEVCDEDYFFDEKGNCTSVNYCSEGNGKCKKCIDNYYLTKDSNACTPEKNCYSGDAMSGICNYCIGNYYIDVKDRKCRSNKEINELFHCIKADNYKCIECENEYYLSEDNKCTFTKNCAEVDNGKCVACSKGYYLGLDNKCTDIEHCIYSEINRCKECEDGFYLNSTSEKCLEYIEGFENCKLTAYNVNESEYYCYYCKNGFYINQTDHLCYNNQDKDNNFYKCLITDINGEYCITCENNYYIGYKDNKCSKIYGCLLSENEDKCLECDGRHCLDVKTGKCVNNEEIKIEEEKFYYRCKRTNEEGSRCDVCLENYELRENGLCVDIMHCVEEENGNCVQCQNNRTYSSCLNSDFGCVPTSYMKCIECNNNLDFDICTKCPDNYTLNEGICIRVNNLFE